ncbi:MAG: hypothetical protein WC428_04570 [Candidatus Paceibacterota bacterium]|jgi:hypothetical protein
MRPKVTNKAPSKEDIARMLRRKGVMGGTVKFDFSKIENEKAITGIASYLVKKIPRPYNVVIGFISDNSGLSRSVAESLRAMHYFAPQDNDVRVVLERFDRSKEVNVLLVKALVSDVEMDEWYYLPQINENVQIMSVAAIADGRFLPYENHLEVFSLIDYDYIYP